MQSKANTPNEYVSELPEERKEVVTKLRQIILGNLPLGFEETMSYGMLGYVVPHSIYPDGYHCSPELPLPFMSVASQKNFVAVYHMGIYADDELMKWFINEFPKHCKRKLDMGKSCIRFKKMDDIPYELIGKLCAKTTTQQWIDLYDEKLKKK